MCTLCCFLGHSINTQMQVGSTCMHTTNTCVPVSLGRMDWHANVSYFNMISVKYVLLHGYSMTKINLGKIGRRLLGASRTVHGCSERWLGLEEAGGEAGREKAILYGKRLENLEDIRLVKVVAEKLKNTGGVGWWEEYELLQRRYGLADNWESESRWEVKSKIEEVHVEN